MSYEQHVLAGNTPGYIHIAAPDGDGGLQDMSADGWLCYSTLADAARVPISTERQVTNTEVKEGVEHFRVDMSAEEAALLVANADETPAEYYWYVRVQRASPYYRNTHTEDLLVHAYEIPAEYLTVDEVEADDTDTTAPITGLPEDSQNPYLVQRDDQILRPGRQEIPESEEKYYWGYKEANDSRDRHNSLAMAVRVEWVPGVTNTRVWFGTDHTNYNAIVGTTAEQRATTTPTDEINDVWELAVASATDSTPDVLSMSI